MRPADAAERLSFGRDVLSGLYPGSVVTDGRAASGTNDRGFAVLPSAGHPRLLVPASPHRAAGVAMRAYGGRLTRRTHWGYGLAAASVGVTGTRPLSRHLVVRRDASDPAIDDHLSEVLGRTVSIAIHLTPARANRKPVLQAIADGRHPAAFVKAAVVGELPGQLVNHEAEALRTMGEHPAGRIVAPRVEHVGDFGGLRLLVLRSLPTWRRGGLPTATELRRAVDDIAGIVPAPDAPFGDTPMWSRLRAHLAQLPAGVDHEVLAGYADRVHHLVGDTTVRCGSAHGDFSPWNLWQTADGLLVWDWERFDVGFPVGHDLLHYRLQELIVRRGIDPGDAAHQLVQQSGELLDDLVPGTAAVAATTLGYLMSVAVRYLRDDQTAAGSRLGDVGRWLFPAIGRALDVTRPDHLVP